MHGRWTKKKYSKIINIIINSRISGDFTLFLLGTLHFLVQINKRENTENLT